MAKLRYFSEDILEKLRESVPANLERYRSGEFSDLSGESGWEIETTLEVDLAALGALDPSGTPEAEVANSRLVWDALKGMTPSLACEERIWVRLTHVECLAYARARWLTGPADEKLEKAVHDHFFANTRTRRRDDNAVARLWWNAWIADRMMPGTGLALERILRKADVRANFVERPRTVARVPLGRAIVRALGEHDWLSERDENFRRFMVSLNRAGAGILFEAADPVRVISLIRQSYAEAGGSQN